MILRGYVAGVLCLCSVYELGGAVPVLEERAGAFSSKGAPRVGLAALQACTASTQDEACTQNSEIVAALDADEYVTGEDENKL